jgi:hypothetical protein
VPRRTCGYNKKIAQPRLPAFLENCTQTLQQLFATGINES